ncbi:hypothetical protein HKD21_11410 [Gluconobacter cerevisiae]|uniref:DUF6876 domain-containing protein n=2 Tax=Gluconobacter TaxID=441 RepID=A0ABR9YFK3_9PROT|nr:MULTISPECIES: DUF6876 family protein [Gluconobacter]MBF0877450.1 hypothetical protein [Gluconobacter cerevisiae]GBR32453.1 hypothetical protein AA3266_1083 [Gluconobacter kondonii NBRC 3266]GLQ65208.1 hypothetical protein GCM10007870_07920 [Gluconobacter kondonii]
MSFTQSDLRQFTGSTTWWRLPTGVLLTDGAKFIAENGCSWIIDLIGSHQLNTKVKAEEFQTWTIRKYEDNTAIATCTDGGKEGGEPVTLTSQKVLYTDMPVKEIKLYRVDDGENRVIMLNTEY